MCSQLYDFFRDQGSIIAGLIALAAGMIAYRGALFAAKMQVEAQQRRDEREVDTLRKSLAIEIRQMIGQALAAHNSLKRLVNPPTTAITARMVESSSRIPSAVVYPGNASKIGLLGGSDAIEIVIFRSPPKTAMPPPRKLRYSRSRRSGRRILVCRSPRARH